MSFVLLQGGGLSRQQIDQVPLGGLHPGRILRRWFFAAGNPGRGCPADSTKEEAEDRHDPAL